MCAKSFENPLIPHKRLREIYTSMVETRMLGKHLHKGFLAGTEACWVGAAIGLRDSEGDFLSTGSSRLLLDYILGARLKSTLRDATTTREALTPSQRIFFALGTASRMAVEKRVTLLFVTSDELSQSEWKQALAVAIRLELPVVFIAIPAKRGEPGIAELALKLGVPGIPVDAGDAVAMYRVAQESIGRARAGGGAALIEGIPFPATGDPIALLGRQLISKGAATQGWINKVEPAFLKKLPDETQRGQYTSRKA